jgi:dCTP deaminase
MILSSDCIKERINEGSFLIKNFQDSSIRPASYLLRLNKNILLMKQLDEEVDTKNTDTEHFFEALEIPDEGLVLKPNSFILGSSVELLSLPDDLCGELSQLSCYARIGLSINFSANYVAPTFGSSNPSSITFEIKNESCNDIRIYPKVNFCHIRFMKLTARVAKPYDGIYGGHSGPKAADFNRKPAKG